MKLDDLDALMRAGEAYHSIRVPPGCWIVVRVDGRSFTRLTNDHFARPFDTAFHRAMVDAANAILVDLGGVFASAHSDEISILFPRSWSGFDRELEKTVSIAAGLASAQFTLSTQVRGVFDGRLWVGATDEQVIAYFRWRQADAARSALNSMAYWALRRDGKNERQATAILHKQGVAFKNELLFGYGINFNETPTWQRRGAALYWEHYEKVGHNPIRGSDVVATRRRIHIHDDPPVGDGYDALIRTVLSTLDTTAVAPTTGRVERTHEALASLERGEGPAIEDVIADQIAKGHVTPEALEKAQAERLAETDPIS